MSSARVRTTPCWVSSRGEKGTYSVGEHGRVVSIEQSWQERERCLCEDLVLSAICVEHAVEYVAARRDG